jgi:hypothetical protein
MPRGGELSSFKVPGVGNLLHSCKKNTNPGGIARGGMVTAGIDPCIIVAMLQYAGSYRRCVFCKQKRFRFTKIFKDFKMNIIK